VSRHARGLHAGTDSRARQARAATGERRLPVGRNRRLGRRWGHGLRGQTDGRAPGWYKQGWYKQDWAVLADGRAGRWTAQIEPNSTILARSE